MTEHDDGRRMREKVLDDVRKTPGVPGWLLEALDILEKRPAPSSPANAPPGGFVYPH